MVRYDDMHGQLEGSEKWKGIIASTEGWSGVRMVRHNGQYGWLE